MNIAIDMCLLALLISSNVLILAGLLPLVIAATWRAESEARLADAVRAFLPESNMGTYLANALYRKLNKVADTKESA